MQLVSILAARSVHAADGASNKVTKVGAGYVYHPGTDYRCKDCVTWIKDKNRCFLHGKNVLVGSQYYCTYWAFGTPMVGTTPTGAVTPEESGLGAKKNGTLCRRCEYFNAPFCKKVDEKSPGDTPGIIHPDACCANQDPKESV